MLTPPIIKYLGPLEDYSEFVLKNLERFRNSIIINLSNHHNEEDGKYFEIIKFSTNFTDDNSDLPLHLIVHIYSAESTGKGLRLCRMLSAIDTVLSGLHSHP